MSCSDNLFKLFIQIINKPDFSSLANKIDKPRPDMKNVAAFTITKKFYNTLIMYKSFAFVPSFCVISSLQTYYPW